MDVLRTEFGAGKGAGPGEQNNLTAPQDHLRLDAVVSALRRGLGERLVAVYCSVRERAERRTRAAIGIS